MNTLFRHAYMTVRNSAAFVGHVFNVPAGVLARYKRAPQTAAAASRTAIESPSALLCRFASARQLG